MVNVGHHCGIPKCPYSRLLKSFTLHTWSTYKKLWKITVFNGKIHYKWPCSIVFCKFSRGYIDLSCFILFPTNRRVTKMIKILQTVQSKLFLPTWPQKWHACNINIFCETRCVYIYEYVCILKQSYIYILNVIYIYVCVHCFEHVHVRIHVNILWL